MQLLRGRTKGITTLAISPDSRYVVAAAQYVECHIWDLREAKPKARLLYVGGGMSSAMVFPTPTTLIAYHSTRWSCYDLGEERELTLAGPTMTSATYVIVHPAGSLIKTLNYHVSDIHSGVDVQLVTCGLLDGGFEPVEPAKTDQSLRRLLGFDPSGGRYLAEGNWHVEGNSGFHLRDTTTDEVVATFRVSPRMRVGKPHQWAFTTDGRRLFAIGRHYVVAYDCAAGGPQVVEVFPTALDSQFDSLAVHPGGLIVATVEDQRTVTLRDADTLQPLRSYDFAMPKLTCVAFTPDGTRCVVGNSRGKVLLFDVE